MIVNLVKTMKSGKLVAEQEAQAPALEKQYNAAGHDKMWHRVLERRPVQFLLLSTVAIVIGGVVEMIPTFLIKSNIPTISAVKPYTPLELQGRDIYIREGCNTCHSQMVRPFRSETERYGEYSKAGEFVYDHPHLWGSKRTGPDLHRIGGRYPDAWHYKHMLDPSSMSPGSIMPAYPWLITDKLDVSDTGAKIRAMMALGVPYPVGYDEIANNDLQVQAAGIARTLAESSIDCDQEAEIIALIAYLQRLGTDIRQAETASDGR